MDETRAIARLPHLQVEIRHRRLPEEQAEQLAISLKATPSFAEFAKVLERQAPWPWLAPQPWLMWAEIAHAAWQPWLAALAGATTVPSPRPKGPAPLPLRRRRPAELREARPFCPRGCPEQWRRSSRSATRSYADVGRFSIMAIPIALCGLGPLPQCARPPQLRLPSQRLLSSASAERGSRESTARSSRSASLVAT